MTIYRWEYCLHEIIFSLAMGFISEGNLRHQHKMNAESMSMGKWSRLSLFTRELMSHQGYILLSCKYLFMSHNLILRNLLNSLPKPAWQRCGSIVRNKTHIQLQRLCCFKVPNYLQVSQKDCASKDSSCRFKITYILRLWNCLFTYFYLFIGYSECWY